MSLGRELRNMFSFFWIFARASFLDGLLIGGLEHLDYFSLYWE